MIAVFRNNLFFKYHQKYHQLEVASGNSYTLRHVAISEMIMGGMDSFVVAKLAGTSVAMIEKHYGHLRHEDTRHKLDAIKIL